MENLNIERPNLSQVHTDPTLDIIKNFERHPSILKIKDSIIQAASFSSECISKEKIIKERSSLDTSKATEKSNVPEKLLKGNSDIFPEFLFEILDNIIESGNFLEQLKWTDVKPIHRTDSRINKKNDRPVSILPNISKIYDKCFFS